MNNPPRGTTGDIWVNDHGIWVNETVLGLDSYGLYVLYGEPGEGKTTAAAHLVAYDLAKRLRLPYAKAFREALNRIYMGSGFWDVLRYLRDMVNSGRPRDWLILDDAALGFHDLPRVVWASLMDILKTARGSLVTRGIVFTTTSRRYISRRILDVACVLYVKREADAVNLYKVSSVIAFNRLVEKSRAHPELVVEKAMSIPISQEYALPKDFEEKHMEERGKRIETLLGSLVEMLKENYPMPIPESKLGERIVPYLEDRLCPRCPGGDLECLRQALALGGIKYVHYYNGVLGEGARIDHKAIDLATCRELGGIVVKEKGKYYNDCIIPLDALAGLCATYQPPPQ
jgi:hypothetical protein